MYEQLEPWASAALRIHIALVSGGDRPNRSTFGNAEFSQILTNFAPRAKQRAKMTNMPQDGEIFFPEDLHSKNIHLFDACNAAGITGGMDAQAKAAEIFHPRHPIYGQLFELQTLEVVRLIEGEA